MNESKHSPEDLYRNWYEWVTDNLGCDPKRASIAAQAATELAARGGTFAAAADAARVEWTGGGGRAESQQLISEAGPRHVAYVAKASPWVGPGLLALPLLLEVLAIVGVFAGASSSGDLFAVSIGVLFLGVPIAYVLIGAALLGTSLKRYAAIAAVLAPASVLLNAFLALMVCEAAVRGINYAYPP